MKKQSLNKDEVNAIEQAHNVYVDAESMQYNVGGGYDAVYGWEAIPQEWIEELEKGKK
jgi:ADP-ribosylglycohydrolase